MTSPSKANQKLIISNLNTKRYISTKPKFSQDWYLPVAYSLKIKSKKKGLKSSYCNNAQFKNPWVILKLQKQIATIFSFFKNKK